VLNSTKTNTKNTTYPAYNTSLERFMDVNGCLKSVFKTYKTRRSCGYFFMHLFQYSSFTHHRSVFSIFASSS